MTQSQAELSTKAGGDVEPVIEWLSEFTTRSAGLQRV